MTVWEQLNADLVLAMKSQEVDRLSVLRMLKSALKNQEIALGHTLTDTETFLVLEKQSKQRKEAANLFENGGRTELAEKELSEVSIIEQYLPKKMPTEELTALVDKTIEDLQASSIKDMGGVIKSIMELSAGTVDGKELSEIVRTKLS
ncbi:MAG: GatB/YqeY domain-containing protein [bacterium]